MFGFLKSGIEGAFEGTSVAKESWKRVRRKNLIHFMAIPIPVLDDVKQK